MLFNYIQYSQSIFFGKINLLNVNLYKDISH